MRLPPIEYILTVHGPGENNSATFTAAQPFMPVHVGELIDPLRLRNRNPHFQARKTLRVTEIRHTIGVGETGVTFHMIGVFTEELS